MATLTLYYSSTLKSRFIKYLSVRFFLALGSTRRSRKSECLSVHLLGSKKSRCLLLHFSDFDNTALQRVFLLLSVPTHRHDGGVELGDQAAPRVTHSRYPGVQHRDPVLVMTQGHLVLLLYCYYYNCYHYWKGSLTWPGRVTTDTPDIRNPDFDILRDNKKI